MHAPVSASRERQPDARYAELDAYRGMAAVAVVLYHTYTYSSKGRAPYEGTPLHLLFRNLDGGVAWFFVLSGFLIFLPFARAAVAQCGVPSARGFLVRRALRILPVYYLAILLMSPLWYTGDAGQALGLLEHLTFTHVFDSRYMFGTIASAWSVGVEMVYYLALAALAPLASRVCGRLRTPRARVTGLAGATVALILLSLAFKWWAVYVAAIPSSDGAVYYGPLARADEFALGMLLAVLAVAAAERPWVRGRASSLVRLAGFTVLVGAFAAREANAVVGVYFHTLSGLAFALVLASTALGPRGSAWERALSRPALRYLGTISYSTYLWHELLVLLLIAAHLLVRGSAAAFPLDALLVLAVTMVVGSVSYQAIERPALRLRHRLTPDGRLLPRVPAHTAATATAATSEGRAHA